MSETTEQEAGKHAEPDVACSAMLGGRALDALVAERVMGATVVRVPFAPRAVDVRTSVLTDDAALLWRATYPRGAVPSVVPRFSTDIAAAWKVVERLTAAGYIVTVWNDPAWTCEISKPEWRGTECESATTAPLAICRAALQAVAAT